MKTHIALFDTSVQETQQWLTELMERLDLGDPHYALHGLTAVLHALRDELSANQNAALAAQLPTMLRGIYFQDWQPEPAEPKHRTREVFLERVLSAFDSYVEPLDAKELIAQVFAMLEERISGECRKIRRTLSPDLRELWPPSDGEFDEQ